MIRNSYFHMFSQDPRKQENTNLPFEKLQSEVGTLQKRVDNMETLHATAGSDPVRSAYYEKELKDIRKIMDDKGRYIDQCNQELKKEFDVLRQNVTAYKKQFLQLKNELKEKKKKEKQQQEERIVREKKGDCIAELQELYRCKNTVERDKKGYTKVREKLLQLRECINNDMAVKIAVEIVKELYRFSMLKVLVEFGDNQPTYRGCIEVYKAIFEQMKLNNHLNTHHLLRLAWSTKNEILVEKNKHNDEAIQTEANNLISTIDNCYPGIKALLFEYYVHIENCHGDRGNLDSGGWKHGDRWHLYTHSHRGTTDNKYQMWKPVPIKGGKYFMFKNPAADDHFMDAGGAEKGGKRYVYTSGNDAPNFNPWVHWQIRPIKLGRNGRGLFAIKNRQTKNDLDAGGENLGGSPHVYTSKQTDELNNDWVQWEVHQPGFVSDPCFIQ
jgi:hypothetical protein